jgi:diaminohydroxyphosphoribosylaminopyrimidine deaminase/5-amino-6-(5-phosphoribosylamino)uracil reductase
VGDRLTDADRRHLERCLELAERGARTAAPNPMVGSVVVRDGAVVGEGWHVRPGEPHAERHALAEAGDRAIGATVYVSLEPCSHHGRTPPCTEALIAAGVARVVVAAADPDPRVDGSGLARLSAAGIAVDLASGEIEQRARRQNAGFRTLIQLGRPHVTYKVAVSRDGHTAPASGERTWISSPSSRALVHELRARSGAVAVGIGTVLGDDPDLTARDIRPPVERQPVRVVFDRRGRLPADSRLATSASAATPVLDLVGAEATGTPPARVERVVEGSLESALAGLGQRGIAWLLVEGGATIATALLDEQLIDRMLVFTAPVELGGGPGMFTRPVELPQPLESRPVGPDILTVVEFREP